MDADYAALRAQVEDLKRTVNEQASMIKYLDERAKDMDADRMTYAKHAMGLARQMRTLKQLCEDGAQMADETDKLWEQIRSGFDTSSGNSDAAVPPG